MQFLKILFWCLLAFLAAVFTIGNWQPVEIHLWGGMIADVNLPLLLFVTFLIGFVPMLIWHQASRWRLRQRLASTEQALAEQRALNAMPEPLSPPPPFHGMTQAMPPLVDIAPPVSPKLVPLVPSPASPPTAV